MGKRGKNPLPGCGAPVQHSGNYSWTNSFTRGGSQMWAGDGRKSRKSGAQLRGLSLFYLLALGGVMLYVVAGLIVDLFR